MMRNTNSSQANTAHFKLYIMLVLCPVFSVGLSLGAAETQEAFLDTQTIYDGWEANYGHIKSMRFSALETQDGSVKWRHWEKIEDGKRMYARTSLSEKGFADTNSVIVRSFNGKVGKQYTPKLKRGTVYRGLKGSIEEILNPMKACLYGGILRTRGKSSNLQKGDPKGRLMAELREKFPEGIPCFSLNFVMGQHLGQVRVLPNLESVAGQMCHVVEIGDSKSGTLTKYWVAHEKGMLPLRYVTQYAPDDYAKMEVIEIANVETDLGQVWYPGLVKWERKRDGGIHRREMRVHEFIPHIKVPPETFDIDFPVGTKVHDLIADISYIVGQPPSDGGNLAKFVLDRIMDNRNKVKNFKCTTEYHTYSSKEFMQKLVNNRIKETQGRFPPKAQQRLARKLDEYNEYKFLKERLALDNEGLTRVQMVSGISDIDGSLPKETARRILTWDGESSITYREGPRGRSAMLSNRRPLETSKKHRQPWRVFGGIVSDRLAKAIADGTVTNVERKEDGTYHVEFLFNNNKVKSIAVIDPSQGYSVALEENYENGQLVYRAQAKFGAVSPNTWFPIEGEMVSFSNDNPAQVVMRTTARVSEIIINDPNFYDDLFHVDFPEGTQVSDLRYVGGGPMSKEN